LLISQSVSLATIVNLLTSKMSNRVKKLLELQRHLECARLLLDELTREAIEERERIEKEEQKKKKEEEIENKRGILLHTMVRPVCEVLPEVITARVAAAAAAAAAAAVAAPQEMRPDIHPRLWHRRQEPQQVFTIPQTEEWDSEATRAPFALEVPRINWEQDWSRRCVCGARPGRCQH